MNEVPKILVLCGRNKKRSRTAEHIFKHDHRLSIRSAGVSPKSEVKVSTKVLIWADLVLVMEKEQGSKIKKRFQHMELPPIEVLDIPDDYEFMDEELVQILRDSINEYLRSYFED